MVDLSGVLKRLPDLSAVGQAVRETPAARSAATPFVAGDSVADVVVAVAETQAAGMGASVRYLPEPGSEAAARLVHLQVVSALVEEDLAQGTDLTVDVGALGLTGTAIPGSLRADLEATCRVAHDAGMTLTLAGLTHASIGAGLALRTALAETDPDVGITVAAQLHRTESDCLDLAQAGARVRLVKRAARESATAGFTNAHDIDKAYVRCLRLLLDGAARTTVATDDSRLIEITAALVERAEVPPEHAFLFARGLAPAAVPGLLAEGVPVVLLQPFGPDWAGYVAANVGASPATVGKAARAAFAGGAA